MSLDSSLEASNTLILDLSIAISNPPINDRFRETATNWNGTRWKIIVVGTKKIRSREQASLILSENIKRTVPLIKSTIAANNMIFANGSGNPLPAKYCAWIPKSKILPGIAFTKIALRSNLPRKFKE